MKMERIVWSIEVRKLMIEAMDSVNSSQVEKIENLINDPLTKLAND